MPRISRQQLVDVISDLPEVMSLDPNDFGSALPDDLFLCALGFEPRCLELPSRLKEGGYRARRAYYFKYATNFDDNAANQPELVRHLRDIAPVVEPMESDDPDFPNRFRAILDLVCSEASAKPPRVTLDISVAANRIILRCIRVLLEYDIVVRIIYSEAAVYHPTKEEYEQEPARWEDADLLGLEQGVSDVVPSSDHPGAALDLLPDSVLLFPSFSAERSKAVISFVDPSLLTSPREKVVWLLGIPHLETDRWRLEAIKKINGISQDAPQKQVSTFDYKETLRALEHLYTDLSENHTITLSPLGSKMQALGSAIFCYMRPDVRIIFAMPKEYNASQYSKGCKAVWQIGIGPLAELRRKLDQVGTLRVDD